MSENETKTDAAPEKESGSGGTVVTQRKTGLAAWRVPLLAGLGISMVLGGVFAYTAVLPPASRVRKAPAVESLPGGKEQANSQRLQQSIDSFDEQKRVHARETGGSSLSTLKPLKPFTKEEKPKIQQVVAKAAAPPPRQRATAQDKKNDLLQKAITAQIEALTPLWKPGTMKTIHAIDDGKSETGAATPAATGRDDSASGTRVINAGDILYARTVTESVSEIGGPILVELADPPFTGARLIGRFSKKGENLVAEFQSLTLPWGETVTAQAYALNLQTARTAVASDVDYKIPERAALIFAGSFLEGFAESAARTGQTIGTGGLGTSIIAEAEPTTEQSIYAGAEKVAKGVNQELQSGYLSRDFPIVTLYSGEPIGLLFMEPVDVQKQPKER